MQGILRDLFKNWSGLDDSRFLVETVSGGITNFCKFFYFLGFGFVVAFVVMLFFNVKSF